MTTDGERWTRRALADLRDGRFRPAAWFTFLRTSFERANLDAARAPRARRQVRLLTVAAAAGWGATAVAGRPALAVAGVAWWVLVAAMLRWHLGMLESPAGRRMTGLGLPNLLSVTRLAIMPVVIVSGGWMLAVLLAAAALTDVVDGPLARRRDLVSRLGFWLDGAADAGLLVAAAVACARTGALAVPLAAAVCARAVLPWAAGAWVYFSTAAAPPLDGWVRARLPGVAIAGGMILTAVEVPAGAWIVVAGLAGTAIIHGVSATRVWRDLRSSRDAKEPAPPAGAAVGILGGE